MPVPLTGKDCLEFENTPFGATQKSPGNARNEKLKKITKTSYTSCVLNFFCIFLFSFAQTSAFCPFSYFSCPYLSFAREMHYG